MRSITMVFLRFHFLLDVMRISTDTYCNDSLHLHKAHYFHWFIKYSTCLSVKSTEKRICSTMAYVVLMTYKTRLYLKCLIFFFQMMFFCMLLVFSYFVMTVIKTSYSSYTSIYEFSVYLWAFGDLIDELISCFVCIHVNWVIRFDIFLLTTVHRSSCVCIFNVLFCKFYL